MSYLPIKILNFLKSRLIFNIFYCFWMFVNKIFSRAHISKSKRCFNVKSSTYYFHIKTKILADFQICNTVILMYEKRKFKVRVQLTKEKLWPVLIEGFEVSYKYLSGWPEPERRELILQIKLAQRSLIKITFPLQGSPTVKSIYVPPRSRRLFLSPSAIILQTTIWEWLSILNKYLSGWGKLPEGK